MLLELTIAQLDTGPLQDAEASQMGQLGYMQWIAGLPGDADYLQAAHFAYESAAPFKERSPAVAVFCRLLRVSIESPFAPLPLSMPPKQRRGGADARRKARMPI